MRLIVGLGNPGPKYAGTRHNFGFAAVDQVARSLHTELKQHKYNSLYSLTSIKGEQVMLVKPLTFMNRSGEAVRHWCDFYRLDPDQVLVIYDDMDVDLGRIRIRPSGSAGSHNGMKSLIQHLGSQEFGRVRLGIGPQPVAMDAADFVLQKFKPMEWERVKQVTELLPDIVVCWSHEGLTEAMNRFNGWNALN